MHHISSFQRLNIYTSFCIFLLSILFSCKENPGNVKDQHNYASLNDSTTYVGIEACRQCHADKYETYIQTGMGLSFDRATRKKSSAEFTAGSVIHDKYRNLNYYPHWQGDSLVVSEFRISGGDTVYRRNENVTWIVGSGQHTNSHLINENGYIYQAPATFYTQKGIWDLPPGFEEGHNSRFSRIIGLECISCHNALPEMILGSENKYSRVANGIDCERCHGPGGKHVKEKLAGKIVDINREIDYSIVNPAKLPVSLQLDICQRCHIQGNAVLQEGKSFLDFRPGMHLSDVMNVFMPLYVGDNDSHIMASHAERMKMSKCFIVSVKNAEEANKKHSTLRPYKNALTCVTCHDPHVSVRATDQSLFNNKCKSCHVNSTIKESNSSIVSITCSESSEKRRSVNDNCVKCHMPKGGSIDIPHVSNTDHWIRIPVKQEEIERIKKFAGLICINNPSVSDKEKGIAFLSYYEKFSSNPAYLDSAKRYLNDENNDSIISNFKHLIRWAFLENNFKKVIEYTKINSDVLATLNTKSLSNEDAWTAYRIGESYYSVEETGSAIIFFQRAVDLAPFQPDFRNKLAGAQHDSGMIKEARLNYEFIIKENPKYASVYVNLGYLILTSDNNVSSANSMYDKALELDPDNIQAFLNKAGIMLYLGRKKEARKYLLEVLKRDKNNEQAMKLLNLPG